VKEREREPSPLPARGGEDKSESERWGDVIKHRGDLLRDAPRSGPLSSVPVPAKELKERAFQGVL